MKLKNWGINLSLALIGLFVLALVLEVVFSLPAVVKKTGGNVPALWRWRTPVVQNEFNSLGFRDQGHSIEKPPDTKRIIILGDSIVYGQMVEFDQIFPQVLEKFLNRETTDSNYEIISLARAGWNTKIQLEALEEKGLQFDPDLVIVAFYLNDTQIKRNPSPEEDFDPEIRLLPSVKLDRYLDRHSYFYSFVKFKYNRLLESLGRKTDYFTHQRTFYNPDLRGWQQFVTSLETIKNLGQQNQFQVLLVSLN